MKTTVSPTDPDIQAALAELRELIASRYPTATFEVFRRDDPEGIRLRATVDVDDLDEVMDLIIDKLYEIQVERELPVYPVMTHPPERIEAALRARRQNTLALPPLP